MATLSSRLTPLTVSVPAMSEWTSYTPTGPWSTNSTYTGRWRRVGDSIQLMIDVSFSGAPNAANASFTFAQALNGLGLTVDTAKFPLTADTRQTNGTWTILDSGVTVYSGVVVNTDVGIEMYTATVTPSILSATNPVTLGANDNFAFSITLPITGWTSHTASATSANAVVVGGQSVGSKLNIGATSAQGVALLANNAAIVDSNSTGLIALKFAPTSTTSSDVNTLDDYEEGTFTPGIAFGGGSTGVTYSSTRYGNYTKIGNRVFFNIYFVLTSKGSSTGAVTITGLPFTVTTTANGGYSACTINGSGISRTNAFITAYVVQNSTTIQVEGLPTNSDAGASVVVSDTHVSGTAGIQLNGHYITAS